MVGHQAGRLPQLHLLMHTGCRRWLAGALQHMQRPQLAHTAEPCRPAACTGTLAALDRRNVSQASLRGGVLQAVLRPLKRAGAARQLLGRTSKARGWPLRRMSSRALSPTYFMLSRKLRAMRSPCLPRPSPSDWARSKVHALLKALPSNAGMTLMALAAQAQAGPSVKG